MLCLPAILSSSPGNYLHSLLSSYVEPSTRDQPFPTFPLSTWYHLIIYHQQHWLRVSLCACNIHQYPGSNSREHLCSSLLAFVLTHALFLQPTISHSDSSFGIQPSLFWFLIQRVCALPVAWIVLRSNSFLYGWTVRIYSATHCRCYHPERWDL